MFFQRHRRLTRIEDVEQGYVSGVFGKSANHVELIRYLGNIMLIRSRLKTRKTTMSLDLRCASRGYEVADNGQTMVGNHYPVLNIQSVHAGHQTGRSRTM